MTLLRPLLAALHPRPGATPGSCGAIAPGMRELYAMAGGGGVDEGAIEAEVAEIMAAVEGELRHLQLLVP